MQEILNLTAPFNGICVLTVKETSSGFEKRCESLKATLANTTTQGTMLLEQEQIH